MNRICHLSCPKKVLSANHNGLFIFRSIYGEIHPVNVGHVLLGCPWMDDLQAAKRPENIYHIWYNGKPSLLKLPQSKARR